MRKLVQWASTSHLTAMQQNDKPFVSPCVDVFALRHTLRHLSTLSERSREWWMWREGKWTQTSVASSAFSCQSSRTRKDLRHQCFYLYLCVVSSVCACRDADSVLSLPLMIRWHGGRALRYDYKNSIFILFSLVNEYI